ncbi:MAG: hypothetical protein COT35_10095 [Nitrospirae bacterium CG08_land_8_20_14_0_20_52_24]|nr:MAG: hypothetical protein COT35_10095 [Nitrospirae bacterium CG08_land_8_20_14_0_20_52_24]
MLTNMRALGRIFYLAIFLSVITINSKAVAEKVPLSSYRVTPIFLDPGNPAAEIPFEVDVSPSLLVDVASPSDLFSVTLVAPDGQTITPSNVGNFNGAYNSYTLQTSALSLGNPLFLGGYHYTYSFQTPPSGSWKVKINGINLPAAGEVALVNIIAQNRLKVGLLTNETQYIVNAPVLIMATVFDGSSPITGASALATLKNLTSGGEDKIILSDDGNSPDHMAGDGMYSGGYIPTNPGDYAVMAEVNGVTGSGTPFSRDVFSSFGVRSPLADFNGSFNDQGIDANANGFYEYIVLNLGIDVYTSGKYKISLTLEGSNNVSRTVSSILDLTQGANKLIPINFFKEDVYAIGVDGPYTVTKALIQLLENNEWYLADKTVNQWQTQAYSLSKFEQMQIALTGNNSDAAYDTDNNGKFDTLVVSIEVAMLEAGTYQWSARLVDKNSKEIEFISGANLMSVGNNRIAMTFDGKMIGMNAVDGPYYVRNLLIWRGNKSLVANTVYTTQPYLFRDFEGASQPPVADANGPYNSTVGLPITFNASGSYDSDGAIVSYEWDWDHDGTYDESTTSDTITHTWHVEFSGTVGLRVTDNGGLSAIATASVTVTVLPGDLDKDGDVDRNDLNIILAARNQPANGSNDPRDLDGDGMITALDARKLVTMCTRPGCATK